MKRMNGAARTKTGRCLSSDVGNFMHARSLNARTFASQVARRCVSRCLPQGQYPFLAVPGHFYVVLLDGSDDGAFHFFTYEEALAVDDSRGAAGIPDHALKFQSGENGSRNGSDSVGWCRNGRDLSGLGIGSCRCFIFALPTKV